MLYSTYSIHLVFFKTSVNIAMENDELFISTLVKTIQSLKEEIVSSKEFLTEEIVSLKERVQKLEGKHANRTSSTEGRIGEMITHAVENNLHPFLECDLIYARHLAFAMSEVYPDESCFEMDAKTSRDSQRAAKTMGSFLGRSNLLPKLLTRLYIPADIHNGSSRITHNINVWVLRDLKKYKNIKPSLLYEVQSDLWKCALAGYQAQQAEIQAAEPSFL